MAGRPGIELQRVEPRLFGTVPPLGLLSAGGLALPAAVAVLALGEWVVGSLLLVLGLVPIGLYVVAARHLPSSRLSRSVAGGVWRGRDEVRFACRAAGAWTQAVWRMLCLERESRALRKQRDTAQYELGGAAYRGEDVDSVRLRERMTALEDRITACSRSAEEAKSAARERIASARAPLAPTEVQTKVASGRGERNRLAVRDEG